MKATRAACVLGVAILLMSTSGAAQSMVTVYSHDFETSVGPEWSRNTRSTIPLGGNHFLGRFGGQPVTLDLVDLPAHSMVTVSFDLYVIGDWEGSVGFQAGADVWGLRWTIPGECCPGASLLYTTFANCSCRYQAYPEDYPWVHNTGQTGAAAIDSLGYADDSVYQLSYTFYHDDDRLRLHFEGSPDLEDVSDESWGIDDIQVEVDDTGAGLCKAVRSLPAGYGAGYPATVAIAVEPKETDRGWVVEEVPPGRWQISDPSDGGVVMGGKVVWGPFADAEPRELTYRVTPPADSQGSRAFRGTAAIGGETKAICGEADIEAGPAHPADTNADLRISPAELASYGEAWKRGGDWTAGPMPIPGRLVTSAGLLWRTGATYHFDGDADPPWVAGGAAAVAAGSVTGAFDSVTWRDGVPVQVVLRVDPVAGTSAWLLEDSPPEGWAVVKVGSGGIVDPSSGKVRWGPFLGDAASTLTYIAVPSSEPRGLQSFVGLASFDGSVTAVQGERTLGPAAVARPSGSRRVRPE